MGHRHLSRREILDSIVCLGSGSLLVPQTLRAQASVANGIIRGKLLDGATGKPMKSVNGITFPKSSKKRPNEGSSGPRTI